MSLRLRWGALRMKRGLSLTLPSSKPSERSCGRRAPSRAAEVAVRGGVVELQVEGLVGRRFGDFAGRQFGQVIGLVVAGQAVGRRERAADVVADVVFARLPAARVPVGAFDRAVVVHQVAVEVVVGVGVEDRVPGVPAGRHDLAFVVRFVAVAVEELADVNRFVAGVLHPDREVVGQGPLLLEAGEAAVGLDVALDVVVVGVAPGEQADPRRAAEGVGDVVAVEGHPAFGDQVEGVRHRPGFGAAFEGAVGRVEAVERLVVGLDDDEARFFDRGQDAVACGPGRSDREAERREQAEQADRGRQACGKRACFSPSVHGIGYSGATRFENPSAGEVSKR